MQAQQPIQAIIFDLGGVLLDWDPRHLYRRYFDAPDEMEAFLKEVDFAKWNALQDAGRPFAEGVAELSKRFPHRAELIRAYHQQWEQSVAGPIDGSVQILNELKRARYPMFALSNWSSETFPIAQRKYDFLRLFDDILISGNVRLIKPNPRIFALMQEQAGYPAPRSVLIDDSAANVAAAEAAGFCAVLFRGPEALERELMALGVGFNHR